MRIINHTSRRGNNKVRRRRGGGVLWMIITVVVMVVGGVVIHRISLRKLQYAFWQTTGMELLSIGTTAAEEEDDDDDDPAVSDDDTTTSAEEVASEAIAATPAEAGGSSNTERANDDDDDPATTGNDDTAEQSVQATEAAAAAAASSDTTVVPIAATAAAPAASTSTSLSFLLIDKVPRIYGDRVWDELIQEASTVVAAAAAKQQQWVGIEVGVHRPRQCFQAATAGLQMHCVEPSPNSFALISKQAQNHASRPRIHLHNVAASDRSGLQIPFRAAGSSGDSIGNFDVWNMKPIGHVDQFVVNVTTKRLDDLIATESLEHIFILKVDTQGHEPSVFAGLSETLLKQRKIQFILTEYWPKGIDMLAAGRHNAASDARRCQNGPRMLNQLASAGYKLYALPTVAHPAAPKEWNANPPQYPPRDATFVQHCQWYYDMEQRFPSDTYRMGYWTDILAVAPGGASLLATLPPQTPIGRALVAAAAR